MINRADSPWYPTLRLYRQHRPGEWTPVVAAVIAEVQRLVAARQERPGGRVTGLGDG